MALQYTGAAARDDRRRGGCHDFAIILRRSALWLALRRLATRLQ
jgi:hypothetical protein